MTNPDAFVSLINRLARIAHSMQFSQGLNPAQWEALRYLARANKYSTTPGVLADYLGTTKGTISQTLIALEAKGLVHRIRCKADRRKVRLGLTEAGRALLKSDPLREVRLACAGMPDGDCARVVAAMSSVLDDLCGRREGPRFGVCGTCCHLISEDDTGRCDGSQRCGLTGEPLESEELLQICVNFQSAQ